MIQIHLRFRCPVERQTELRDFLSRAIPYYELPGRIRVDLMAVESDPTQFCEVVTYDSEEAYFADQERVKEDPVMRQLLEEWRSILDGPPDVETLRSVSV